MLKEIEVKSRQLLSDVIGDNINLGYYQIHKIIKNRSVKINGIRVGVDQNVNGGDLVCIYLPDREKDSIEVVYRDDNILVVSKTSGIEVQGEDSLTERINNILIDAEAVPVHRLDRNTMGLVVFALNKTAEKELLESFKVREIDKTYNCVVVGVPRQSNAKLKAFLFKDAKKSLVYIINTVFTVAQYRQPDTCQMRPYLVRSARNGFYFQQRQFAVQSFNQLIMRFYRLITCFLNFRYIYEAFFCVLK